MITTVLDERGIQATPTLATTQTNTSPVQYENKYTQIGNETLRDVEVQTIDERSGPSLMPRRKRSREESNFGCSKKQRTDAVENVHEVEVQTDLSLMNNFSASKRMLKKTAKVVSCRACDIKLHKNNLESHVSGGNHRRNAAEWVRYNGTESDIIMEYNDDDVEHHCAFCNCGFTDEAQALYHYRGV